MIVCVWLFQVDSCLTRCSFSPFLDFRSFCLWQRGKGLMQESRMNLSVNLQLLQTLRHQTVMMRYNSGLWVISYSQSLCISVSFQCSSSPSSGLLVVPKVKRRLSRGKGLRRRMPQRKKWTKQRHLAPQMGTAQQRAQHQKRVRIQLLSFCIWAAALNESAQFILKLFWRPRIFMVVLHGWVFYVVETNLLCS